MLLDAMSSSSFVSNTSWHHIARDFPSSSRSFICVSIQFRVYKKMIFISGGCHVFINILTRFSLNNWLGHKFFRKTFLVGNWKRARARSNEKTNISFNRTAWAKIFYKQQKSFSFWSPSSWALPFICRSAINHDSVNLDLATPRETRWRQDVNFNAKS